MRNFGKHQQGNSPNVKKGAARALSGCPDWIKQTLSNPSNSIRIENAPIPIGITSGENLMEQPVPVPTGEADTTSSNGVPKKQSSPKADKDPRAKHPAIVAIRNILQKFPDKILWDKIIQRFGDEVNEEKLRACRIEWMECGYNEHATKWLNWYFDGIPVREIKNGHKQEKILPPMSEVLKTQNLDGLQRPPK